MHCNRGQTQSPTGQRCAWLVHFWPQGLLPCSVVRQVSHDKPCIVQSARSAFGTGMWFDLSSACDRGFRQRRRHLCTGLCTRQKNPSGDSARQSAHRHELCRAGVDAYWSETLEIRTTSGCNLTLSVITEKCIGGQAGVLLYQANDWLLPGRILQSGS